MGYLETLLPLAGFVAVMTGTPGPNNLMLMASGANAGFRRSVPHILGIAIGCQVLLLCIALGLGQVLARVPELGTILRLAGVSFLIYLAWQLVRYRHAPLNMDKARTQGRPLTFWQAVLFQWVNPKAWMMMVTAVATYTDPLHFFTSLATVAACFLLLGLPLISLWNLGGVALQGWLRQGRRLSRFNLAMAALLLLSLYPTFLAGATGGITLRSLPGTVTDWWMSAL